jgi:hypothetical protein
MHPRTSRCKRSQRQARCCRARCGLSLHAPPSGPVHHSLEDRARSELTVGRYFERWIGDRRSRAHGASPGKTCGPRLARPTINDLVNAPSCAEPDDRV